METLFSTFISSASAIVICLLSQQKVTREWQNAMEKQSALIEYKLEELKKQVEKHNNVIERTFKLEEKTCLLDEKIRVANHRIEDLERTK